MAVYLINLGVVTLGSFLTEALVKNNEYSRSKKYNQLFYVITLLSLILVSGFRYKVGTDYTNYTEIYVYLAGKPIKWNSHSLGFALLTNLLHRISENPQFFFFITSIIVNVGIVTFIKKYSEHFSLSMYFYITTFVYYGTMNGVRQYIASVIMIFGLPWIIEGNFKKYMLHIVIAALFHSTALIMIPIYFLARRKVYSISNLAFVGIIAVVFVFYEPFVNILFKLLGGSEYEYYDKIMVDTSNGANILRILVWMVPVIFILLYRQRAIKVYGEKVNILINLCIYGMLFMILAYRHVYYARLSMYFDVYYLLLIPKLCSMFDNETNTVMKVLLMSSYFAYSTSLLLAGESWIYPYRYNLNIF